MMSKELPVYKIVFEDKTDYEEMKKSCIKTIVLTNESWLGDSKEHEFFIMDSPAIGIDWTKNKKDA